MLNTALKANSVYARIGTGTLIHAPRMIIRKIIIGSLPNPILANFFNSCRYNRVIYKHIIVLSSTYFIVDV